MWNQIGKANSQLWKLVKKFGAQLDECWFLRFSSKNDYDLHFLTDKRRFLGKKLTPSGKTEILRAGKANTGAFTLDDKDVYPRERPFATILMGEEGNDDEKSAIPGMGGTDFDGNILTIMEALYRRGCGVIMFSDSDIARGENLQSAKQMVFDTFGVTPKRPHSIGICMAQQRDFTTMATALGSDGDNIFEMTYFTADAKEHVEFEDIE